MQLIPTLLLLLTGIILYGCSGDYKNQESYTIKVGEKIEIYVRNNSCCGVCTTENSDLKFVEHIVERLVSPADEDCDGCSSYSGIIYQGVKPGIDTLRIHSYPMSDSCDLHSNQSEQIIIHVIAE